MYFVGSKEKLSIICYHSYENEIPFSRMYIP